MAGRRKHSPLILGVLTLAVTAALILSGQAGAQTVFNAYQQAVIDDGAAAYWTFDQPPISAPSSEFEEVIGDVTTDFDPDLMRSSLTPLDTGSSMILDTPFQTSFSVPPTAANRLVVYPGSSVSVEAWFATTLSDDLSIVTQDRSMVNPNRGGSSVDMVSGGLIRANIGTDSGPLTVVSTQPFNDGMFHHVVLTYDGFAGGLDQGVLELYVDGVSVGTDTNMGGPIEYFGGYFNTTAFLGPELSATASPDPALLVDEIAIYPTALTAAQVDDHYTLATMPPPPPVDPCGGVDLLECYAPEIRFHVSEDFYPMDPLDFIEGSELWWSDSGLCSKDLKVADRPTAEGINEGSYVAQSEAFSVKGGRFGFPVAGCFGTGERYESKQFTRPFSGTSNNEETARPPGLSVNEGFYLRWTGPAAYGNVPIGGIVTAPVFAIDQTDQNDNRSLVYLFFYGEDPKANASVNWDELLGYFDQVFAHEGDWEGIKVNLDASGSPISVNFMGHGCPVVDEPWDSVERVLGTHPVGYVAQGTHATYSVDNRESGTPLCGSNSGETDQTNWNGNGAVWQTWQDVQVPQETCWYGFGGAWGEKRTIVGVPFLPIATHGTGPAGPAHNVEFAPVTSTADCDGAGNTVLSTSLSAAAQAWLTQGAASIEGYEPGRVVRLTTQSLERPLAVATVGVDGTANFTFEIPEGTPPGRHQLMVRDGVTGQLIAVTSIDVDAPADCLVDDLAIDDDGDLLANDCDPNPFDGPLADADFDFVPNVDDNCPLVPNRDQAAIDDRSSGVVCDEREGIVAWDFVVEPELYPLPPTTIDDTAMVAPGETVEIDVLANDSDPDNDLDEGYLEVLDGPAEGTVQVVVTDGAATLAYTAPSTSTVVGIEYIACDDRDRCATAVLTIQVLGEEMCTIIGTDGDDTLIGTEGDDVICGLEGDDIINALGGNDIVLGGDGRDQVFGGDGNDQIMGGRGHDELYGNAGDDLIRGRRGNDEIFGGSGNDELRGGRGQDVVRGGNGDDTLFGGRGDDELRGGVGDDLLRGRRGADTLFGGAGADDLYGGMGHDLLRGGEGDDVLRGKKGDDWLVGGDGTDVGRGGNGFDSCVSIEQEISCEG